MKKTGDQHIPVMLDKVIASLDVLEGALIIDGTFGDGGYSREFIRRGSRVIGIDRDPNAVRNARALVESAKGRFEIIETLFSQLDMVTTVSPDAIVLDVGVSSMQIDQAERGFSFLKDGPLDMRMSKKGVTAATVINHMDSSDLARIFRFLGEEKHAKRIARMIDSRRKKEPFTRTGDLAKAIKKLITYKPGTIHPATRVFQALRIYVNDELGELARALFAAERILKPHGRLAIVTFHSLEDRIVKRFFIDRAGVQSFSRYLPPSLATRPPCFISVFKKGVIVPCKEEVIRNRRARSAKLRVGIRTGEPAWKADPVIFALPTFTSLASFEGVGT
ncbi:MAG: 16S rRNA (cytosine1402-N4)-methyltransferase [Candidatus Tokpelaia sp. JSC085]|nr:MAG: 16S rRNA (cytosine1402-N4)-methyltransferase [Candidatus Tokpelaia sp. JSC085]